MRRVRLGNPDRVPPRWMEVAATDFLSPYCFLAGMDLLGGTYQSCRDLLRLRGRLLVCVLWACVDCGACS